MKNLIIKIFFLNLFTISLFAQNPFFPNGVCKIDYSKNSNLLIDFKECSFHYSNTCYARFSFIKNDVCDLDSAECKKCTSNNKLLEIINTDGVLEITDLLKLTQSSNLLDNGEDCDLEKYEPVNKIYSFFYRKLYFNYELFYNSNLNELSLNKKESSNLFNCLE